MTNDFIISPTKESWRVVAISDRGKAFAARDERFVEGRAELDAAQALPIYQELHGRGYRPSVPEGLPPPSRQLLYTRLAALLLFLLVPLVLFQLLA